MPLGLLPDVRNKVEEAADDRRSSGELTHSVDERALKVCHDFDGPVEHSHPHRCSQPLDEVEGALVNWLRLPLQQTVQDGEGDGVGEDGVDDVQLVKGSATQSKVPSPCNIGAVAM